MNDSVIKKAGFFVLACMFSVSIILSACHAEIKRGSETEQKSVAIVMFDIDTGKVLRVTRGDGTPVKPIPVKEAEFNGKRVIHIPAYSVIITHSSPGCFTYIFDGVSYTVCM